MDENIKDKVYKTVEIRGSSWQWGLWGSQVVLYMSYSMVCWGLCCVLQQCKWEM